MNEREILEQRAITLRGLIEVPGGPFTAAAAAGIGERLVGRWKSELRLIERILDESKVESQIVPTLEIWRSRTSAFLESSEDDIASWTDRSGTTWNASSVLEIIAELDERIANWCGKKADEAEAKAQAKANPGAAKEPPGPESPA